MTTQWRPWRYTETDTWLPNIRIYPMIIPWLSQKNPIPNSGHPKKRNSSFFFGLNPMEITTFSGCWLTYPSEKYEFVSWDDEIPNFSWKVIKFHGSKPPTRRWSSRNEVFGCLWQESDHFLGGSKGQNSPAHLMQPGPAVPQGRQDLKQRQKFHREGTSKTMVERWCFNPL